MWQHAAGFQSNIDSARFLEDGKSSLQKSFVVRLEVLLVCRPRHPDEKVSPSSGTGKAIEPRTLSSGRNKLVTLKPGKTGYTVTVHRTAAKALDLEEFEKLVAEALDKKGVKLS